MHEFPYHKYRWFYTSNQTLVVGGKSAEQNDALLHAVLSLKKRYYVLHTSHPGSPFSVILKTPERVEAREIEEAAIFTGCFSRAWKERKKKTLVSLFMTSDLLKKDGLAVGTWNVKKSLRELNVLLELVLTFQKKHIRAVPPQSTTKPLLKIIPGSADKTIMAAQIAVELNEKIGIDSLLGALPAGGIRSIPLSKASKIRPK